LLGGGWKTIGSVGIILQVGTQNKIRLVDIVFQVTQNKTRFVVILNWVGALLYIGEVM
jgi:hypothetical protein